MSKIGFSEQVLPNCMGKDDRPTDEKSPKKYTIDPEGNDVRNAARLDGYSSFRNWNIYFRTYFV